MSERNHRAGRHLLLAALVLAGCAGPAPSASPTPATVELPLRTVASDACPEALMPDVRLAVDPGAPDPIVAITPNGDRTALVFPAGSRAALHGDAELLEIVLPGEDPLLVGPNDRVSFGGGAIGPEGGDAFFACSIVR